MWLNFPVVDGDTWRVWWQQIESYEPAYKGKPNGATRIRTKSGDTRIVAPGMDEVAYALEKVRVDSRHQAEKELGHITLTGA